MKAMSLGVIQGVIDQVVQIVRIKRVQPRVLNMQQVESLRTQLNTWTEKVHEAVIYLEATGPELMSS
ncbi:hypothetical protein BVRB_038430 [Beta vulgaris subsp. vulgaris]|uniref:PCI domain-containing protein n=1 Tax=Beta vulgaris subsp. vulgaris TaxID=3555 RepID=A0A0J7YNQ1_BETVV|nr:hypothetical protein BVRB_038430 [Beta vulgaris subsp. vulgaris]